MKDLLFFDTESGNGHISSMCSFGYILTDENFNIKEQGDIFMNPERKFEKRVLNEVLFYSKEHYQSFPNFKNYYNKIKSLFQDDTIVFGHAIVNDVKALNQACERYELPYIDFNFYASDKIYKEFTGDQSRNEISLDKISQRLKLERQNDKHTSLQDAKLVMLQIKKICDELKMDIYNIIELTEFCKGENVGGKYNVEKKPIIFGEKNNLVRGNNHKLFINCLKETDIEDNKKSKYNHKIVSMSSNFEYNNFKKMIAIVRLLAKKGGYYTGKGSDADYYVIYGNDSEDKKLKFVKNEMEKRKVILIKLEDFLSDIEFNESNVDEIYNEFINNRKRIRKKKNKTIQNQDKCTITLGELLSQKN